jgi:hypothetical protein
MDLRHTLRLALATLAACAVLAGCSESSPEEKTGDAMQQEQGTSPDIDASKGG